MNRSSHRLTTRNYRQIVLGASIFAVLGAFSSAAPLQQARVTQIINDVKLLPSGAAPRPAVVNDEVRAGAAVRTGDASRTELTFSDLTIARLGASTVFSFDQGARAVDLSGGAILLRVPKNSGGAKINTAAVTAAITGTTMLAEYHANSFFKFIMLEGTARICRVPQKGDRDARVDDCRDLHTGEMLVGKPGDSLQDPVDVDLERLISTSLLLEGFGPLGSEDEISRALRDQLASKVDGRLIDDTLVAFNSEDIVKKVDVIDQRIAALESSPSPTPAPTATPTPTPQPTPQKFGTPPVIVSSVPYAITNGSVIVTDPTITTNGVVDEGRIFRNRDTDGAPSAWLFTATSQFDLDSGFDAMLSDTSGRVPFAGFKFQALQLAGNPTVLTGEGGPTNLALVSVGDMISGGTSSILTFGGMNTVVLATQNGSILLGPEITFSGTGTLIFHARGEGAALTLGSAITGVTNLQLNAEGSVRVNGNVSAVNFRSYAGVDFRFGNGAVQAGMIDIRAGRDVDFDLGQFAVGDSSGHTIDLLAGRDVNIDAGGDRSAFARAASIHVTAGDRIEVADDFEGPQGELTIFFESNAEVIFHAGLGGIHSETVAWDHLAATAPFDWFSEGEIVVLSLLGADNLIAATSFTAFGDVITINLETGTFVTSGGNLFALDHILAGTTIDVAGQLSAPSVTTGGNVTANLVTIRDLMAPTGILTAGDGGIRPFLTDEGSALQHTFTVDSIVSPEGIQFGGDEFRTGEPGTGQGLAGGRLTIFANSLSWDFETGIGTTIFDGDFGESGGDGGILIANATGDIFVGEFISATTGHSTAGFFGGAGGMVTLDAGGMLTVNSTIFVSSNDIDHEDGSFGRNSNSGGDITLHSGLLSGAAIFLNGGSRLLSYLNAEAPGAGGTISITTEGGDIFAYGEIAAERGTIIISNGASLEEEPVGITLPLISIDNFANITAETLLVSSGGDLDIGREIGVFLDAITVTLSALNDINGGVIDLYNDGQTEAVINSSGNVMLLASRNITLDSLQIVRRNAGRTTGLNVIVNAGADLSLSLGLSLRTDASGLDTGGNIHLTAGGDMSLGDFASLQTALETSAVNGANILVNAGGGITAGGLSASVFVNDTSLENGGNITLTAGDDVLITGFSDSIGLDLAVVLLDDSALQSGGNISAIIGGDLSADRVSARISGLGSIIDGANINFAITGNLTTFVGDASFIIEAPLTTGTITPFSPTETGPSIHVSAADITIGNSDFSQDLTAYIDDSDGQGLPSGAIGSVLIESSGAITLFGTLNVLGTVTAVGDITAGTVASTNVMSNTLIAAGQGGIRRFGFTSFGAPVELLHTLTAAVITSVGGINFNGLDADFNLSPATSGGSLTLNVANGISFESAEGDILGSVTLNGGNAAFGRGDGPIGFEAGDGGNLTVNAGGDIIVESPIEATTGAFGGGRGGSVALNSTDGTVAVNSRLEVSSNSGSSKRFSAQGGKIAISSGKAGAPTARAVAIDIRDSSQLLALLAAAPTPGNGGQIVIRATGANSDVNIKGRVQADNGVVDIRHTGSGGEINVGFPPAPNQPGPAGLPPTEIRGDIIKIGALGDNGVLRIGGGTISADTTLQLYAPGSNGQVVFIANVNLTGNSTKHIAGHSVTINSGVLVNIGGQLPANVYVNSNAQGIPNANYSGFGGNGTTTGTFTGAGATPPQPLGNAPPIGAPPGGIFAGAGTNPLGIAPAIAAPPGGP